MKHIHSTLGFSNQTNSQLSNGYNGSINFHKNNNFNVIKYDGVNIKQHSKLKSICEDGVLSPRVSDPMMILKEEEEEVDTPYTIPLDGSCSCTTPSESSINEDTSVATLSTKSDRHNIISDPSPTDITSQYPVVKIFKPMVDDNWDNNNNINIIIIQLKIDR
ncbi:hypothetical protein DFA_01067 [Cavenderia fasciculata]|uniref:Uncharacterized protein n=1 Tax=Cavenderia fasciculata TaxID=261658 RepID=F4PQM5_CACFS|nr:uncharacterized protein DFA_01067 [Cavenderia fasciculata]EGG21192.1 hypothetical protein DFA_01067 [Cavenderia fasciculata]|eukprot:XP_004359042.1 hypothetical protein DFA_01067 [Cavenderia fasciculata]